jgi:dTDP-glucose 4,6-dehydratase
MKLLVTGGAGFIGSNFIRDFLKNNSNSQIINLDLLTYAGNLENLKDLENNSRYHFIKGDINDRNLVFSLVKSVDAIVHMAAESHVDRSIEDSSLFVKTNVLGTHTLLEAARLNNNKRFHHISTDEVYGSLGLNDPKFKETSSYDPRSPYSASKAAADHLVRAYWHTYKLPITISNCSNNYGPYQYPEKLIPLFITNLMDNKKVPVYGEGKNIRDWIHVSDHNRAVEKIIKFGKIGLTYCIGGGNELSNLEITKEILKIMNKEEDMIEYVDDRLGHDFRYAIDYSLISQDLNWQAEISFHEGLKDTISWYINNEAWWRKLKNKF